VSEVSVEVVQSCVSPETRAAWSDFGLSDATARRCVASARCSPREGCTPARRLDSPRLCRMRLDRGKGLADGDWRDGAWRDGAWHDGAWHDDVRLLRPAIRRLVLGCTARELPI